MLTLIFTVIEGIVAWFAVGQFMDHGFTKSQIWCIVMGLIAITDIVSMLIERYK
jgi:hypothetical protein